MTPLDELNAGLGADDEAAHRAYYAQLLVTELFVPLDEIGNPLAIEMNNATLVLAFDTEDRLIAFAEGESDRAVISGRMLIGLAHDWGAGLGVNLGVAETAYVVPQEAVDWLCSALDAPSETQARVAALTAPNLPEAAVPALDRALAALVGEADAAYLVGQPDGDTVLLIAGAASGRQDAIAAHISGAMAVQFPEHPVSVGFIDDLDVLRRAAKVGLIFEIPQPQAREITMPGSDPEQPPRLR